MTDLRILVLGTGNMAAHHVKAFQAEPGVTVVAGVDVDDTRARIFCDRFGIERAFGSIDEAIAWGGFDAASNVTPDAIHHPTTMKLIAAGKPVLCEKPLAENFPLADEMANAAEAAGLVAMVNLSYRNVPALQKARALIGEGKIGQIRHVEASYRQSWLVGNHWGDWRTEQMWLWRLSEKHGSKGVLGDVGIHILDMATYAIGADVESFDARLKTFDKAPGNRIGEYPLDANDSVAMTMTFTNGALGVVHASRFMTGYANTLRLHVFGDEGALELDHGSASTTLRMCSGANVNDLAWREVVCEPVQTNYSKFIAAIRADRNDEPTFRRAADLQKVIDGCFTGGW